MYRRIGKRVLDVVFGVLALPFLGLVCVIVVPQICLADHGPAFHTAMRLGRDGKLFRMYKFRTMITNAPDLRNEDGSTYNAEDDPRVTRVGRFLRRTSIDEAPQVLNIVKGDMSWIGPRPDLPEFLERYTPAERKKLEVRPGVSGYSQAYFRNSIELKARLENDVYYVQHMSFRLDIMILLKTVHTVLVAKGVYISHAPSGAGDSEEG